MLRDRRLQTFNMGMAYDLAQVETRYASERSGEASETGSSPNERILSHGEKGGNRDASSWRVDACLRRHDGMGVRASGDSDLLA